MLDFQKLDPFWNLWSKPNPGISSKILYPARFFRNFERQIGHEIFVKTEKTEYLSNQLTSAHFNRKLILIFWISKMFQISGSPTVKKNRFKICLLEIKCILYFFLTYLKDFNFKSFNINFCQWKIIFS